MKAGTIAKGGFMYHCCQFKADDIYCLEETELYSNRMLSIGFCPVCHKPVAELLEELFTGGINKVSAVGINAQNLVQNLQKDILYSMHKSDYPKTKSKPFGWRYGINKETKHKKIKQYACDFYGNKELIKEVKI